MNHISALNNPLGVDMPLIKMKKTKKKTHINDPLQVDMPLPN